VAEGAGERADDLESKALPKANRGVVGGDDEVELHRAEPLPARLLQAMIAHRTPDAESARARCDHERSVRDMRAKPRLVGSEDVGPQEFAVVLRDIASVRGVQPVGESVISRDVRVERIGVSGRYDHPENLPDAVAVGLDRGAERYRRATRRVGAGTSRRT